MLERVKKVIYKFLYAYRKIKRIISRKPRRILFYPDTPEHYSDYGMYKTSCHLGYKIVTDPKSPFDIVMAWQDQTFRTIDDTLNDLREKYNVINGRCDDISKVKVDAVFKDVFGYSLMVDPLTFEGLCAEKQDLNAKHDGQVVQCPINERREGYVYQILLNNIFDDDFVEDIRVPVFRKKIPFIYLKYKQRDDRFGLSVGGKVARTHEHLSGQEIEQTFVFCERMGLDYGEVDMIRNKDDGKLYIIDANNTPSVRFSNFKEREKRKGIRVLAKVFDEEFMLKK